MQTACHHFEHLLVAIKVEMHFGRDVAYVSFNVPDAFAGAATMVEYGDIVAVALRIVAAHQAEQGGFARTVFAEQSPFFATTYSPIHAL